MNLTCPCCHAAFSVETVVQDEAARELLALRGEIGGAWPQMIAYLGCFRSAKRALAWDRALRLAREVLALAEGGATPPLQQALAETVEAMRVKRLAGDVRPLKNHNYLRRVLEGITATGTALVSAQDGRPQGAHPAHGKRRQAVEILGQWGAASLLRQAIAIGLTGLVSLSRPGTPAVDMIEANAEMWLHWFSKAGLVECDEDVDRVHRAFSALCREPLKEWPAPAAIEAHLPRRQPQRKLREPVSEEAREASAEALRKIREGIAKGVG